MCVCSVAQSCPTLCSPTDCGLPGSSVHGMFLARILERVAISSDVEESKFFSLMSGLLRWNLHKVEVTIPLKSLILRAEESQEDYYAAIDVVIDKLERQIRKNKTRIASTKKKEARDFAYGYIEEIEEDEEPEEKVVKRKKIDLKPMSEEEAILQMELLEHSFYLYKDADTDKPTLVYKRKDGDYGIIES